MSIRTADDILKRANQLLNEVAKGTQLGPEAALTIPLLMAVCVNAASAEAVVAAIDRLSGVIEREGWR